MAILESVFSAVAAMGRYSLQTLSEPPEMGRATIAIYHCTIKRSEGRSAVAAAAYRSGQKLTNEWDGQTHAYTPQGRRYPF